MQEILLVITINLLKLIFFPNQTTPPHTPYSYPVSPAIPAGKSPPASRLCSVCRSRAAGFGRCLGVRVRRRWWRVFGYAGCLKTRQGRGGAFAYTTARPRRRFAPSFLPSTSLERKAGFVHLIFGDGRYKDLSRLLSHC